MLENRLHHKLPRRSTMILAFILALMLLVNTAFAGAAAAAEDDRDVEGKPVEEPGGGGYTLYMPVFARAVPRVDIMATQANTNNEWTVSWTAGETGVTGYVLQESYYSDFSVINAEFNLGLVTSRDFNPAISWNNEHYYRVRAVAGTVSSVWSNVALVRGGYFDDFNDTNSGWDLRRTSFLEKTVAYYGSGSEAGNYIIIVDDRWDWMIASPLKQAPPVPYVINYRARVHDPSNLVSGGMAFAGDWNGSSCPDVNNIYQHTNCFNRFHNLNYIFYGPIKLLYEHIHELVWCPTCGGSLLKRIGDTFDVGDVVGNGPSYDFHNYRVEVREENIKVFFNGNLEYTHNNTAYVQNQPYFGVFASTEEYKPSIWFFDYVEVKPLD